jgi:hypothetical protein
MTFRGPDYAGPFKPSHARIARELICPRQLGDWNSSVEDQDRFPSPNAVEVGTQPVLDLRDRRRSHEAIIA